VKAAGGRSDALDMFRGFAILTMVLANYLAGVTVVPAWLKHAPDVGLTFIDLIAPFFIFAIGVTFGPSFRKRNSAGGGGTSRSGAAGTGAGVPGAVGHFVRRYLGFIGIGAIIAAGEAALGMASSLIDWGVLQAIGAAGLVTLTVIALPPRWRFCVGLALLAAYQVLLDLLWLPLVLGSSHGGLPGAMSWAAMLIIATAAADDSRTGSAAGGRRAPGKRGVPAGEGALSVSRLAIWGAGMLAAGIILAVLLPELAPISKNRVSASYVLVSAGASSLLLAAFSIFSDTVKQRIPLLSAWGKNPLVLYVLHYIILGIVVLPGVYWWYEGASPLLTICQAVGLVGALSMIAWLMEKKGFIVSL
jgi:predicted acyltransferase